MSSMTRSLVFRTLLVGVVCGLGSAVAHAQNVCSGVSKANNTQLRQVTVVSGLTRRPLFLTAPTGDRDRLFIVEQDGYIRLHKRGAAPTAFTTFLDIDAKVASPAISNEMGLLGLAFDPNYATNGFFYVNYTEQIGLSVFSVVARYSVMPGDPDSGNPASEVRLLRYAQPQTNHNGGWLAFGPDGYLYISSGDGGGGGDLHGTCGNGQGTGTVLGKILRIDPAQNAANRPPDCSGLASPPYRIPADNPFVGSSPGASYCEEVYAYGLRNPWRPSFDRATGDLYIADVGQNCWEEVNFSAVGTGRGKNFGWRQMEGTHCFDSTNQANCNAAAATSCTPPCNDPSLTRPILDYGHAEGCSVTGGYAYRGCRMPNFAGRYFYADYCSGWVRSFVVSGGVPSNPQDFSTQLWGATNPVNSVVSFAEDGQGEMYVMLISGEVRLISAPFFNLEVSGDGAGQPFLLSKTNWSWEDLARSSRNPVDTYRVYRSSTANGSYNCIFRTTATSWTGDTALPLPGASFFYIVTALNAAGEQTTSGNPPRNLSPASCP